MNIKTREKLALDKLNLCFEEVDHLATTTHPGAISEFVLNRLQLAGTALRGADRGRRAFAVELLVHARENTKFDELRRRVLATILALTL
jgi:hypothetical protein